jgi:hypothetical protein
VIETEDEAALLESFILLRASDRECQTDCLTVFVQW